MGGGVQRLENGDSHEWRSVKRLKLRGLPWPIRILEMIFIAKETYDVYCMYRPTASGI